MEKMTQALWRNGASQMAAVLLVSLGLVGCGPQRLSSLRNGSHLVCSFEVEADYATVYERLARSARQRYVSVGMPTHQPGVSAELFPESQSGSVTLWDSGRISLRYRLSAEIQAIDSTHAKVNLYAAGKSDRREARLWVAWANVPLED